MSTLKSKLDDLFIRFRQEVDGAIRQHLTEALEFGDVVPLEPIEPKAKRVLSPAQRRAVRRNVKVARQVRQLRRTLERTGGNVGAAARHIGLRKTEAESYVQRYHLESLVKES